MSTKILALFMTLLAFFGISTEKVQSTDKTEAANLYKAVIRQAQNANVGFEESRYMDVKSVNVPGSALLNNSVLGVVNSYVNPEKEPVEAIYGKGTTDAKKELPPFDISDYSVITSGKITKDILGIRRITLTFVDYNGDDEALKQVTNMNFGTGDAHTALTDAAVSSVIKTFSEPQVTVKNLTITVAIDKNNKIIEMTQTADYAIHLDRVEFFTVVKENVDLTFGGHRTYSDFDY